MKKLITVIILLTIGFSAFGEEMGLKDIFKRVLQSDETLKIAEASIDSAYQGYRITRGRGNPQITLSTDPVYGVGMRRDYSFDDFPPETRTTVTNSFNFGIGLSQLLPTGGVITTSIEDTFQYNVQLAEEDLDQSSSLQQQPGFSLNYNQPLFVNGKLIDGQLMKATNQSAELGWQSSKKSALGTKNSVLLRASVLYMQLLTIEKNKEFIKRSMSVAEDQLEQTKIDRDRGRASENQVLGLEVAVNRQQKALLDIELAQIQAENQLGSMIRLQDFSAVELGDSITGLLSGAESYAAAAFGENPLDTALRSNPDILVRRFDRESKRLQAQINDSENAPNMSLFFTLNPRYPDDREDEESFTSSFSDFFTEDAGVNLNFGLSFDIPVSDGGTRKARREADETGIRLAELNIAAAENSVREQVRIARKKDELLRQRLELLQVDMTYQRNRLEREERLASLNTSTKLEVDKIRLDILSTENQLWETRVDLFINLLELISVTGTPVENIFSFEE